MDVQENLEVSDGIWFFRPQGESSLTEAVDMVSLTIARCREQGADKLLVNANGLTGVSIPTLIDRFLLVEEWAQQASSMVAVVMVVPPEFIHPEKFGIKVAEHFGLTANVFTGEDAALHWLSTAALRAG
jgi:hypothetical protein